MIKEKFILFAVCSIVVALWIAGFLLNISGQCDRKPKPNIVDIVENYNVILLGDGTLQLQERK